MKKWPFMLLVFTVWLSISLAGQKKIKWLDVKSDKSTGKVTITANAQLLMKGVKEGNIKWEGHSLMNNPILSFLIKCDDKFCSNPIFYIALMCHLETWEEYYLDCHSVYCIVDGEVLELPEENKHYSEIIDEIAIELLAVPSDRATFEKLWNGKLVEMKICDTEFTLSPIEMRVLQELKAFMESFEPLKQDSPQSKLSAKFTGLDSLMSPTQKEAQKILEEALRLLDAGRVEEAFSVCDSLVNAIAKKSEVKDGRDSEAVSIDLDFKNIGNLTEAYFLRGRANFLLGKNEDAEADYLESIGFFRLLEVPENDFADVRIELCRVRAMMAGRSDEVVKELTAIIDGNPEKELIAEAYAIRGGTLAGKKDYSGAIADLNRAIAANRDNFTAYRARALVNAKLEKFEAAIADWDQVIRLAPDNAEAQSEKASLVKRLEVEKASADRAAAKILDVAGLIGSAEAHEREGDMPAAIMELTKALTLSPQHTDILSMRARIYRKIGEFDKAIADYDSVIKSAPRRIGSYDPVSNIIYLRGLTKLDKGDYEAALDDLGRLATDNERWSVERHEARAKAYIGLGNFDGAAVNLSWAIHDAPSETDAHELSRLYLMLGKCHRDSTTEKRDVQKALQDFTKAIELDRNNTEALLNRAELFLDLKQWQQGIDDASKALELNPKDASALNCRGICYQGIGDVPAAIKDYEAAIAIEPDSDAILSNVAWLLATEPIAQHRDGLKAVRYAEKAVELTKGQDHNCLDTLAAAYAEAGRFKEAVASQEKAIALEARDSERNPATSAEYKARLQLYKTGKPFRR